MPKSSLVTRYVQFFEMAGFKVTLNSDHLDILLKHSCSGCSTRDFAWLCRSNKFSGDASATGQWPTQWDPLMYRFWNSTPGLGVMVVEGREGAWVGGGQVRKGWQLVRGEQVGEKMENVWPQHILWRQSYLAFVLFFWEFSLCVCSCSPHHSFFFSVLIFLGKYVLPAWLLQM